MLQRGGTIWTKDRLKFVAVLSTNLCIDVSPHDELRILWDLEENSGEVLIELFMWNIVTWVIDRRKEDVERFPFCLLARTV